jgi:hypothetical protein
MIVIAGVISMQGIGQLKTEWRYLPDSAKSALRDTEARASEFGPNDMLSLFNRHVAGRVIAGAPVVGELATAPSGYNSRENRFYEYVAGPVTGVWQVLIQALILGYLANLFIAGGMLTYLVVREDDYWDDEDLEDLDKLAKELEEEAKRDQGVGEAPRPTEPAKTAEAAKPVEPPPVPATEPAKPADKPAEPPKA